MQKRYLILVPSLLNRPLSYQSSLDFELGEYCLINLRNKLVIAIILGINDEENNYKGKIKEIESKLYLPKLSINFIQTLQEVALYQMEPIGMILKIVIAPLKDYWKKLLNDKVMTNYSIKKEVDYINPQDSFILNPHQEIALAETKAAYHKHEIILLEGETGSGKTEIYLELIKEILLNDPSAQILILLPEIALTNSLLERIEQRLKYKPLCWHSALTPATRRDAYLKVIFGQVKIVIGARSAIFLPFKNLQLIIIDEEHDSSFKQEQGVIYHAIDVARIRAKHETISVILSSATPSLETIYEIKQKNYKRIFLKSEKTLTERMVINLHNMKDESSIIADKMLEKVEFYLEKNLQSMIFLNRRGYNSLIICAACKNKITCKNCSVNLVYHKELHKLFCHYCGFNVQIDKAVCPTCLTVNKFKFWGFGIERIYEIFKNRFPERNIILISSDNDKNISDNIKLIETGQAEIIIGTQILAKGHNFPKLAFLGIIDGGLNFSGIDLRSAEKTYQVLHQITGRVGRFNIKGEVLIQTHEPQNLILDALKKYNRTQFYMNELENRKNFLMPPFCTMIKMSFSSVNQEHAEEAAIIFLNGLTYHKKVSLLGPSPSAIVKLNRLYRYNIFLQADRSFNLQEFLAVELSKVKINSRVLMRIDVNPMSFI